MSSAAPAAPKRLYPEIDVLKAVGILAVILIHGVRPEFEPSVSDVELWINRLTRFAVPAFLFASGFLYATTSPVTAATTLRRLRRVLVPYLIASLLAWIWWWRAGVPSPGGALWRDLLFGAAFGPFYYVFVIVILIAVTPIFAKLRSERLLAATLLLAFVQWLVDAAQWGMLPIFWYIRNPLLWWAYFFTGWTLRIHYARVEAVCIAHRAALVGVFAALAIGVGAALAWDGPRLTLRTLTWLEVYALIGLQFVACCGRGPVGPALRLLADATYTLYLFHLFFVYTGQALFPPLPGRAELLPIGVPWAMGVAGPLLLVLAARRLLGARSRDVIGA